jgi:tRNA modification GTPase
MSATANSRATWLTAAGAAALQVLRLQGPAVPSFLEKHFRGHGGGGEGGLAWGEIVDGAEILDEVLVQRHETGDGATVDLHLHGGAAIARRVRELANRRGFASEAAARADDLFAGGDAIRREALRGLSEARATQATLFFAAAVEGALSREISGLLAISRAAMRPGAPRALGAESRLQSLLDRAAYGLAFSQPPRIVIRGAVNAGKSTLVNALCGRERVVATAEPGTTRDAIEVDIELEHYPFVIVDTAGSRATEDPLEQAGMSRAEQELAHADLVLDVMDGESLLRGEAPALWWEPRPGCLRAVTRVDRLSPADRERLRVEAAGVVAVSARSGEGIEGLAKHLVFASAFRGPAIREWPVPFTSRQIEGIREAASALPRDPARASRALAMLLSAP